MDLDTVRRLEQSQQDEIKLACQTSLRFLVNCILRPPNSKRFPTLLEKVHGRIIDSLPKPRPDKDFDEWDVRDEFVTLASRGMLKSTIGAALITQLILCMPDIRILIMSGKIEKARSILAVARKPFYSNPVIRYLFPEWAIEDEHIKADEFVSPKRDKELDLRDPTLSLASFDSVKAGGHYEFILLDDATNEINSSNMENCEKTHGTYDDTDELVEPGAYRLLLCTKWLDEDLPEYIRKKGEEEKEKSGRQTISYFVLPAWAIREDGTPNEVRLRLEREKTGSLTPEDVILTWPEKLNANFLFKRYRKNRSDFYKQYLLDASVEQQKSFSPEILQRQIQSPTELTQVALHDRAVVVHWDLASVFTGRRKKSETDYSCGIIGVFQKSTGKLLIASAVLAHFNTGDDVGNAIVKLYQTAMHFGPIVGHSMEDAMGARSLESTIYRIAREAKWPEGQSMKGIYWLLPDKALNAKNTRISILASAMKSGYVALMSNIPFIDDIKSQFERWSIDAKRRKDDGPDCIAQIWQYYKDQILPNAVETMKPGGPILSFEPELPPEAPDPHQDEIENADISFLQNFTSPHATN